MLPGIPSSLPCAAEIPNYPTLEVLWLRKKEGIAADCCFDMHRLTERKREQGLVASTHKNLGFLEKRKMTWYRQRAFCHF